MIVSPAPGEAGRLPSFRGDRPARPVEIGHAILDVLTEADAVDREGLTAHLLGRHPLDGHAATNLAALIEEQRAGAGLPTRHRVIVERWRDELGDLRIAVIAPLGREVTLPWAIGVEAALAADDLRAELRHGEEWLTLRAHRDQRPILTRHLLPDPDAIEDLVWMRVPNTSGWAGAFREAASRALLLPRSRGRQRLPLWLARKKAQDLSSLARHWPDFPMAIEAAREVLQEHMRLADLVAFLRGVASGRIAVVEREVDAPGPWAQSMAFQFVGNYLYEGDLPPQERALAALQLDRASLARLVGAVVPELPADVISAALDDPPPDDADGWLDRLRRLGDVSPSEIPDEVRRELVASLRAVPGTWGGRERIIAAEDVAWYDSALGGGSAEDGRAASALTVRWALSQPVFAAIDVASWAGWPVGIARSIVEGLAGTGALVAMGGGWLHPAVSRRARRLRIDAARDAVAPVDDATWARFLLDWMGVGSTRTGRDGLLAALQSLWGVALPLKVWEREVLPARVTGFRAAWLDELGASGELVWTGEGMNVAFWPRGAVGPRTRDPVPDGLPSALLAHLQTKGAAFLTELARVSGAPVPTVLEALRMLAAAGWVTNDTLLPLRSARGGGGGRWSVVETVLASSHEVRLATAKRLLDRFGVFGRASAGDVVGGWASLWPVLRALEDVGRVQRGAFLGEGVAFARPGAVERLRAARDGRPGLRVLSAVDPAMPWGRDAPWPERAGDAGGPPRRLLGAMVATLDGVPVVWWCAKVALTWPGTACEPCSHGPLIEEGAALDLHRWAIRRCTAMAGPFPVGRLGDGFGGVESSMRGSRDR